MEQALIGAYIFIIALACVIIVLLWLDHKRWDAIRELRKDDKTLSDVFHTFRGDLRTLESAFGKHKEIPYELELDPLSGHLYFPGSVDLDDHQGIARKINKFKQEYWRRLQMLYDHLGLEIRHIGAHDKLVKKKAGKGKKRK